MKNTNKKTSPAETIRKHPLYSKIQGEIDGLMKTAIEISSARLSMALSQKELAQEVGTTQKVISKIENADTNMGFDLLRRITKALGLKLQIGETIINEQSCSQGAIKILRDRDSKDYQIHPSGGDQKTANVSI
jgi:ribosome-binding protein aMBF1 (putative translation factor)